MKKKINALVYPFDVEFLPIIRHKEMLEEYDIQAISSLKGLGLGDKDIGTLDGGNSLDIFIDTNFDECLDKCDAVIFTNSYHNIDFYKFIFPKLIKCIEYNKDIICLIKLSKDIYDYIKYKAEMAGVNFKYFCNKNKVQKLDTSLKNIIDINTPIVLILGDSENTEKFEIQLSIRENLIKDNYKVSQIGSKSYCEILGFNSFPHFIFNSCISEEEKILLFNRLVKEIELNENPDIILIGLPGSIIQYNDQFTNGFGMIHYEVSRAIRPDFCILSILYKEDNLKYIKNITSLVKYRFGYDIDCFNISPFKFLPEDSKIMRELHFLNISCDFINEHKKTLQKAISIPVLNILDKQDSEDMTSIIIERLSDYGELEEI